MTGALLLLLAACPAIGPRELEDRLDGDGDGHAPVAFGGLDCDDSDPSVHPDATDEPYDGVDADCSGDSDYDDDRDGFDQPEDCDDADPAIHPGAREIWYDDIDQDCDGASDFDADRDGSDNLAFGGEDCNDLDPTVGPHAPEIWYDGVDQDCAGDSDFDQDGDGGTAHTAGGPDCDDADPDVGPHGTERCGDGRDNDCDGSVDGPDAIDAPQWHRDSDEDGFGSDEVTTTSCAAPSGFTAEGGDCADWDPAVNPGVEEVWYDGVDADCDGQSDYDADGDGYVADDYGGDDCDDADGGVHPGAGEIWDDGIDQNCDGELFRGLEVTATLTGAETFAFAGGAVAWVDVDSDGSDELAVAAIGAGSEIIDLYTGELTPATGSVFLVSGGAILDGGGPLAVGSAATAEWSGPAEGTELGTALARATDQDGDGHDDLWVGSHDGAWLIAGHPTPSGTAIVSEVAYAELTGPDGVGPTLLAGDLDGDLTDDVALAGDLDVYVVAGPVPPGASAADAIAATHVAMTWQLSAGLAAVDLDGDGAEELLLGASDAGGSGALFVAQGAGELVQADLVQVGPTDGYGELGAAIADAGDVDGDGYADAVVGAPSALDPDESAAFVVGGRASLTELAGAEIDEVAMARIAGDVDRSAGQVVAGLGDADGNGTDDLALGLPDLAEFGAVYVFFGPLYGELGLDQANARWTGGWVADSLGGAIAAGDADADGLVDIAAGATATRNDLFNSGLVDVVLGVSL